MIAHEREVARKPVDSVPQHRVVDGRRPAVVGHGHDAHEHRQENETTDAYRRRMCRSCPRRRRDEPSFRTVVRHTITNVYLQILIYRPGRITSQLPTHQSK